MNDKIIIIFPDKVVLYYKYQNERYNKPPGKNC